MDDGYTAEQVRRLHTDGYSQRAIAQQLGISRHRVRALVGDTTTGARTGTRAPINARAAVSGIAGGRVSSDRDVHRGIGSINAIMPLDESTNSLRLEWLDDSTIRDMPIDKLMEVAANASPEMSRGIWDFLRLAMPGHEIRALIPGTTDEHVAGQAIVDDLRERLAELHGAEEVVYGQSFMSAAIRGAMASEIVFDTDGRTAVDIIPFDPATIRFRQETDPVRGTIWTKGQIQDGRWVSLEHPRIRYVAIDRFTGKPYGRAPMLPAIFPALFLLGFYQDLRRVVANQGYPRLHIQVQLDGIYDMLTNGEEDLEGDVDPAVVTEILNRVVTQTKEAFATVEPEDNYVTSSLVDVKSPVGTLGAGALGGVTGIIEALERMCVRAMKTMPLMQGIMEGTGDANANRQWEIHAQGIKSVQHYAENLYAPLYELACQAHGQIVTVEFKFAELRAAEELRDEQTMNMKLTNADLMMKMGIATPNEAAMYAVGEISDAVALSYDDADGSAKGTPVDEGGEVGGPGGDPEKDPNEPAEANGDNTDRKPRGTTSLIDGRALRTGSTARWVRAADGTRRLHKARTLEALSRANEILPVVPDSVPVTSVDERAAAALFDEEEPDYSGMLDSVVVNTEDDATDG